MKALCDAQNVPHGSYLPSPPPHVKIMKNSILNQSSEQFLYETYKK